MDTPINSKLSTEAEHTKPETIPQKEESNTLVATFKISDSGQRPIGKSVKLTYKDNVSFIDRMRKSLRLKDPIVEFLHLPKQSFSNDNPFIPPPPPPSPADAISDDDLQHTKVKKSVSLEEGQKQKRVSIVASAEQIAEAKKVKVASFKATVDESEEHNAKVRITKEEKYQEEESQRNECYRYAGVENFAIRFVEAVIENSIGHIKSNRELYSLCLGTDVPDEEISSLSTLLNTGDSAQPIKWPRIQDFTREIGTSAITEYILTWEYQDEWLFTVNFVLEQSDECSDYYLYEAIWSIPSRPYPIPQAIASVYFTIEVSRVKPGYCPVDVSYVFEAQRLIHVPGKIPFKEQWLFDVIDAKIELYKLINF